MPYIQKRETVTCDSLVTFLLSLPRKRNIWHIVKVCVGEVLLKQWKQGNTWFGKTRKRPLEIGVFFLWKLSTPTYTGEDNKTTRKSRTLMKTYLIDRLSKIGRKKSLLNYYCWEKRNTNFKQSTLKETFYWDYW